MDEDSYDHDSFCSDFDSSSSTLSPSSGEEEDDKDRKDPVIAWTGPKKDLPIIIFKAELVNSNIDPRYKSIGDKFHMSYKIVCDCKLVHQVLTAHGFREVHPNSSNYNVLWTGSHLKPYLLRGLQDYQRINHFPRSYEITRKDRMYKNIQRMQQQKTSKCFDFVPTTFVLPEEFNEFYDTFHKEKGVWIVKPIASSRGRGIFLVSHPNQVPLDEKIVISRYISNPYRIDGYKFDVRLYVLVTSYDPLVIYLFKEGLTRFATVKYEKGIRHIHNTCMHLTNYSINKRNNDYVRCEDPHIEDFGNKWSMSAMIRYLKESGEDTTALMIRIEDVIIKTIISAELPIATACKTFLPHKGNCFEIYGFDILVDEDLRPWVLEVNLSPSLACDTPMDLKIKANLLSDTFNIIGIMARDPIVRKPVRVTHDTRRAYGTNPSVRPTSASKSRRPGKPFRLSPEEARIVYYIKEEYKRKGGFIRIFPSENTLEFYGSFLEQHSTLNVMLYCNLFPERSKQLMVNESNLVWRRRTVALHKHVCPQALMDHEGNRSLKVLEERIAIYKSSLSFDNHPISKKQKNDSEKAAIKTKTVKNERSSEHLPLAQGELESTQRKHTATVESSRQGKVFIPYPSEDLVQGVIKKGGNLSKIEVRQAFSTYLQRIQQRWIMEAKKPASNETQQKDIQMDLVIQFLRRAVTNLHQPFKVEIPNRKLRISDRKNILAKQLGDFVHLYERETESLKTTKKGPVGNTSTTTLANAFPEQMFAKFLYMASEQELEELLTLYTKEHKSAGIFLGTKRFGRTSTDNNVEDLGLLNSANRNEKECMNINDVINRFANGLTLDLKEDRLRNAVVNDHKIKKDSIEYAQWVDGKDSLQRRNSFTGCSKVKSPYAEPLVKRPQSAKVRSRAKSSEHISEQQRNSRFVSKSPSNDTADAIAEALRRLAKRQATRKYSANAHGGTLYQAYRPNLPANNDEKRRPIIHGSSWEKELAESKLHGFEEGNDVKYMVPRPPVGPPDGRKLISSKRIARISNALNINAEEIGRKLEDYNEYLKKEKVKKSKHITVF